MLKNFLVTAIRNLSKRKAFAFLNISGLAIGVTVCLIIGVWLFRELNFDNFHPKDEQIFRLANTFKSESESFSQAPTGPAFGGQLPRLMPTIESSCRLSVASNKVTVNDKQFIESNGLMADSNFFQFFGFKLIKGNALTCLQHGNQIVLTASTAKKYYGEEDPIGRTLQIDGQQRMVVSAIAEDPPVNSQIQFKMILPIEIARQWVKSWGGTSLDDIWVGGWFYTYVRIKEPANIAKVQKDINQIAEKYSAKEWKENKMSYYYFLQPIRGIHLNSHLRYDHSNNGSQAEVNIFSIVGMIVLLLACINYINLTTAGAIQRAKETSVRKVIGASKWQLIRQFFFETLIICGLAVFLGVLGFKLILPYFSSWIGQPYDFVLDARNMLILFGFVALISVVAGIYPSLILSSFNPVLALKGYLNQGVKGAFIRKSLVVFQFTISIALIASIIIISRQMEYVKSKSLGFSGNAVIEVNYNGDQEVFKKYQSLKSELLKYPAIRSVTMHNQHMVGGLGNGWTTTENLAGEEISTSLYSLGVDEDYFSTYGMQLAAGRFFSRDIPSDSSKSVLVNEAAVRTFGWEKPENAIGKRFGKGDRAKYVIGVVRDFNFESLHKPVEALVIHHTRDGGLLSLKVDASQLDQVIDKLKKTWTSILPQTPLQYGFVAEQISAMYGKEQKMEGLFYVFSTLSLLIACFGLFGLTTYVVEHKVKEIGIRKVLGANVSGIVNLLSKDFLRLVFISLVIATPLAWYFMNNWLKDFAYRIEISWWYFAAAGLVALFITLFTVSLKAVKAAMANPVKNLRTE